MSNLRISELDFDQIKTNLKDYLRSQDQFNSYDFEASGLSVLLDVLAYNTHYNAYLANQQHNESFLDSAIKRESVVSKAKHLSYVPRSATAANAIVSVRVNNPVGNPPFLTLDRYTKFSSNINGSTFTFVNTEAKTVAQTNGVFIFDNIVLKEGKPYSYSYTAISPSPSEKYEIPNANVDTTTLYVTVQNSSTDSTTTVFSLVDDITLIDGTSNVYYLEENMSGKYEIFFGDGVLGKKLSAGNIVSIRYLITNMDAANVSSNFNQSFTLVDTIQGNTNVVVSVVQNSTGGAAPEAIDDIKFNAPRAYIAQSRAVTSDDYLAVLRRFASNIESVNVWGGEDNSPPIYGKVFISLKPYAGYEVTDTQKSTIKREVLKQRNVVSVIPEFVDPDYTYLNLTANVKFTSANTTKTASQLQALVNSAIANYFSTDLQKFNRSLVMSRLTNSIDSADASIYGSNVTIRVQKRIIPTINVTSSYVMKFGTKIHPGEMESTRFYITNAGNLTNVTITDSPDTMPPDYNGTGTLYLTDVISGNDILKIGTVNYATGVVNITSLTVSGFVDGQTDIRITASQQESTTDISVATNQILVVDDSTPNLSLNRSGGVVINMTAV